VEHFDRARISDVPALAASDGSFLIGVYRREDASLVYLLDPESVARQILGEPQRRSA
jgi:chemotaxis signal transduction protein